MIFANGRLLPDSQLSQVLEELDRRSHKIGNLKQFHVADHNT